MLGTNVGTTPIPYSSAIERLANLAIDEKPLSDEVIHGIEEAMLKILLLTLLVDSICVLRRWGCDPLTKKNEKSHEINI